MSVLLANYKNEFYKLFVKKKYIIFLVLGMLICTVNIMATWAISLLSRGEIVVKASKIAMTMFPFFAEIFVPLIVFMAITDLFCTEMHDNTIKAILMRPISRVKILISKALAVFTLAIVYFFIIYITCTLLELIFGNPARLGGYILPSLLAYIIDLIPIAVVILMGILVNMLCKSTTLSMFLCIIVYACMKYCNYFVPNIGNLLFTSYMQWHRLWIGSTLPFSALVSKVGIILGTAIILFTGSYALFDKKEF